MNPSYIPNRSRSPEEEATAIPPFLYLSLGNLHHSLLSPGELTSLLGSNLCFLH